MAVVDVVELPEGSSYRDADEHRIERVFRVQMSDPTDSPYLAETATGIPSIGDPHPLISSRKVRSIRVEQESNRIFHRVTVTYATPVYSDHLEPGGVQDNPLLDPIQVDWGYWSREKVIDVDNTGSPVVNTVGDPFDPPYTDEVHDLTVQIIRNESSFNPIRANEYVDAVNSDYCTIAGLAVSPRQALCLEYSARSAYRNTVSYWVVTYRFAFKSDGWDVALANRGISCLINIGGTYYKVRCTELDPEYGTIPATEPQWLNPDGTQDTSVSGARYYVIYRLRPELPFGRLNLAASK